jgi:hypothetical protein
MKPKRTSSSSTTVRLCSNIKSKRHPDVQCPYTASQGDFCSRHSKNPKRFQEKITLNDSLKYIHNNAVEKIQRTWRRYVFLIRVKRQGPFVMMPELCENQNDICTLDSVVSIPLLYRWTYIDLNKHRWIFDIRSLSMLRSQDSKKILLNPYTREEIPSKYFENFQMRCAQLRNQKYCLLHINDADLTEEQLHHQSILDISMKYDVLGYHISLEWLNNLNLIESYTFYYELWDLWNYRLDLPSSIKRRVVPGWNKDDLLFKWSPLEIKNKRDKKWWLKNILSILSRLVSAELKEHKTLGALYGMTALAIASPVVRENYPWLVEIN